MVSHSSASNTFCRYLPDSLPILADESTPLVNGIRSTMSPSSRQSRAQEKRSWWVRIFNPMVTARPWRLFEICDLGM